MNEKINTDLKSLEVIIDQNKFYIAPVVVILICIALFFQFIIPQYKTLLAVRQEAKEESQKRETLNKNLEVLTNTNEDYLDSQLTILSFALPLNKDFGGILNSIYYASQKTGVDLGSFSIQIGDLSKSEDLDKFPTIKLEMPVKGDIVAINSFMDTMSKTFPLSEVSSVKIADISSTINLSFFYKPLGLSDSKENVLINPISKDGLLLIDKLSGFENTFPSSQSIPDASSSSQQLSNP